MPGVPPEWSSADYFDDLHATSDPKDWAEAVESARKALSAIDYEAYVAETLDAISDADERARVASMVAR